MIFAHKRSSGPASRAGVLAGALLLAALTACSDQSGASGAKGGRGRGSGGGGGAPVIVGQAQRKVVPLVLDAIGTVEPIRSATVRAQLTGTLFKIDIHEGQDVAEGDLLFEIDPRPFQNALQSALAEQKRIAVQLETARKQVARYRTLDIGAMISQEQFQQIEDSARTLEAQQVAADAAVSSARLQLSYCSIRAPIAGRTGNFNVHEGDLIRANDSGALVTVNQLNPIYVTFGLAQQHLPVLARYRSQGSLKVDVSSAANEPVSRGTLTFIDNTVDSSTGTIKLKATFPNEDRRLWPGQFATVTLTLATPEVLTIPASAIQNGQSGQHVFVVKPDHTAEFRTIVVERTHDDDAVVARGLTEGETVVTDGQLRVVNGQPVQIKPPEILNRPEGQTGVAGAEGEHPEGKRRGRKQGS